MKKTLFLALKTTTLLQSNHLRINECLTYPLKILTYPLKSLMHPLKSLTYPLKSLIYPA